jgi:hypothetical protein
MSAANNKRLLRTIAPIIAAIIILSSPTLISFVSGFSNIGLFPPGSRPYGVTYDQWTAKWWQWADSIPKKDNPIADTVGIDCGLNQNGPVWFLTGTFGGSAERTCTIPAGKAILLPISNADCSYSEDPNLKTESDLRSCAVSSENQVTSAQATLDGTNLQWSRVQSPLFNFTFPSDNVAGVPPGSTKAVADGHWVFLQPLAPGKHTIHFIGAGVDYTSTGATNFATEVTYHLNVQ